MFHDHNIHTSALGENSKHNSGVPRLIRSPRPGPCLNFGLQLTLSQTKGQIMPTTVLWALSGSNSPWCPFISIMTVEFWSWWYSLLEQPRIRCSAAFPSTFWSHFSWLLGGAILELHIRTLVLLLIDKLITCFFAFIHIYS